MREVDDGGIWSWEEEILVACIPPPHEVWRFPVLMANLQDFAVTLMLAHVVPLDDNPVPDFHLHLGSLSLRRGFIVMIDPRANRHQSPRSLSPTRCEFRGSTQHLPDWRTFDVVDQEVWR